jgi:hypothetical protein
MSNDSGAQMGDANDFVRPFLVTAGRTKSSVEGLQFETLVQTTGLEGSALRFEPARVFALCDTATAIAEISAHLEIPIATVKVIIGDLIDSGHIEVHRTIDTTDSDDIQLISRLIEGVRRL